MRLTQTMLKHKKIMVPAGAARKVSSSAEVEESSKMADGDVVDEEKEEMGNTSSAFPARTQQPMYMAAECCGVGNKPVFGRYVGKQI